MSSATGYAQFPFAIPNTAALNGLALHFQAATLAPANAYGFALSAGLPVELGQ